MTPGCGARQSVINRPLHERHALLDRVLKDEPAGGQSQRLGPGTVMTGRVVKLLPGHALLEGMPQPRYSSRLEDIQELFEQVMQRKARAQGSMSDGPPLHSHRLKALKQCLTCRHLGSGLAEMRQRVATLHDVLHRAAGSS